MSISIVAISANTTFASGLGTAGGNGTDGAMIGAEAGLACFFSSGGDGFLISVGAGSATTYFGLIALLLDCASGTDFLAKGLIILAGDGPADFSLEAGSEKL